MEAVLIRMNKYIGFKTKAYYGYRRECIANQIVYCNLCIYKGAVGKINWFASRKDCDDLGTSVVTYIICFCKNFCVDFQVWTAVAVELYRLPCLDFRQIPLEDFQIDKETLLVD